MKKKKNIFWIVTLVLCIVLSNSAFAVNQINHDENVRTRRLLTEDEKAYFAKLEKKIEQSDKKILISEYEIIKKNNKVKEFKKTIEKKMNESRAKLKAAGYTETQINAIKNFDGSEEMLIESSASLSIQATINDYYYLSSENETVFSVGYKWEWYGEPTVYNDINDIVGAIWPEECRKYSEGTYSNSQATVYHRTGSQYFDPLVYAENVYNGGEVIFEQCDNGKAYYAEEGIGDVTICCNGKNENLGMKIGYGHSGFYATNVGLSAGAGGASLGIDFTFGTDVMDSVTIHGLDLEIR